MLLQSLRRAGRIATLPLALSISLAGCSLAPKYELPMAPVPAYWSDGRLDAPKPTAAAAAVSDVDWQAFVVDPNLRELIALALSHNRSLRQTLLDVEIARAQHRIERAPRFPTLQVEASSTRQRQPPEPGIQRISSAGVGLPAFELDLFGRLRNLSDAAMHEYLATDEAARSTRLALVADVIETYLTREGAQHRYFIANRVLEARQTSLDLTEQLRERGFVDELDYRQALGLVQEAEIALEQIDLEFRQASNALGLLVGVEEMDQHLPTVPAGAPLLLGDLAAGAPSDLILNRPDIRAAEQRLLARNAGIGAARAAFFPRISLTGSAGSSSAELSDLFSSGTKSWSFAPQLVLPIFDGGANRANLDIAHLRKDAAIAGYEEAIQIAFREVSDALAALDTLAREETAQAAASANGVEARRLSELRYRAGVDDQLRFLDAQRSAFDAELALIDVRIRRQVAQASLFRALGGGWLGGSSDAITTVGTSAPRAGGQSSVEAHQRPQRGSI